MSLILSVDVESLVERCVFKARLPSIIKGQIRVGKAVSIKHYKPSLRKFDLAAARIPGLDH